MNNKILYFSDCYIYGGSERSIINIANSIAGQPDAEVFFAYRYFKIYQMGVERDLSHAVQAIPLSLFSNSTFFHRINLFVSNKLARKILKLPFWIIQKIGIYALYNYFVLRRIFSRIKPDLIHINNGGYPASPICQTAVFAAKHSGVSKIIYHINNPAQRQGSFFDKFIDQKINEYVDYFITASKEALESLSARRFFDKKKLVQIYNTIESPTITKSRQEICEIHHVSPDKFVLCEVAFLSVRKGQIFILKALNKIKSLYPDIFSQMVLFLVGDGEEYHNLKQYCDTNSLNNIIFTGYKANSADYIASSDLFLLPSISGEDMPLAVLTAMNLEKSIIAGAVAGIVEEIEHLNSGILLKGEEMIDLHLEIIKLFSDPKLRNQYGQNAKRRFEQNFSQPVVYGKIKALYQKLGLFNGQASGN